MAESTANVRYEILRKIARGGMGEVFLARQISFGGFSKEVVLKRIHETLADDPDFVEQFLEEARIAAMLDHPNIVQIVGLGQYESSHFIVMEYVHGLSLSRLMKRVLGPLPLPLAVQIAAEVASGLQYAHEASDSRTGKPLNLVHRDISPPNILLGTVGSVKITDFGIAKVQWSESRTRAGVVKGKYSYLSPEQVRGKPATRQSDLYALGLNLYEMTTGQRAYPAGDHASVLKAVARGKIKPPDALRTDFPKELKDVLMRALAVNVKNRYTACAQLQEDLVGLLDAWGQTVNPGRLGQFVSEVMAEENEGAEGAAPEAAIVRLPTAPGAREAEVEPVPVEEEGGLLRRDTQIVEIATLHLRPEATSGLQAPTTATDLDLSQPLLAEATAVVAPPERRPEPLAAEEAFDAAATLSPPMRDARRRGPAPEPAGLAASERPRALPPAAPRHDEAPGERRKRWLLLVPALLVGAGAILGLWFFLSGDDPTGQPVAVRVVTVGSAPSETETASSDENRSPASPQGRSPSPSSPVAVEEPTPATATTPEATAPEPGKPTPTNAASGLAPPPKKRPAPPRLPQVVIAITTDPTAEVLHNQRPLGRTPLEARIPKASTVLTLRNKALGLWTTREIHPHGSRISAHFVFRKGTIGFRTTGPCLVEVDNVKLGQTPRTPVEVYEGFHRVYLKDLRSGRQHRTRVMVLPGKTTWVEMN